jgi:PAS domain S-box-containing protein
MLNVLVAFPARVRGFVGLVACTVMVAGAHAAQDSALRMGPITPASLPAEVSPYGTTTVTNWGPAPTATLGLQASPGPSATGNAFIDFFTGGGSYMPRIHGLTDSTGQIDWPWVVGLVVLSAGAILAYLRIFVFWMKSYLREKPQDRNQKLFDLAAIFLLCATCGYAMSMLMFAWPGYRLLACSLLLLNVFLWKFCVRLDRFGEVFGAERLERQLHESMASRAQQLEKLVATRTAEANRLAEIAKRTANAVVITDNKGLIEWVNEGFTRITGYTLEEIVGRSPGSILQGPESDPVQAQAMKSAINRGESITAEQVNYAKCGRMYIVRIEIAPLRDENNVLTGFMAIESDITEARTTAENLKAEREKLVSLVRNLPGVAFRVACDDQWTNLFVSDAIESLTGYPASDFINNAVRDCQSITHPDDRAKVDQSVEEAVRLRQPYSIEYRIVHKSGGIRWVNERGRVIFDGDTPKYLDGVQFDITELREAREKATVASHTKSLFLANMSHEIRTPLTAIVGYADLLRDEATAEHAPEHRLQAIETIRNAGAHLLVVINDILDLSKIEADKMVIESTETSLPEVLREVFSLVRPRAISRGLALNAQMHTPVPERILSDPTRLRQILMNLVGNAAKFTAAGSITVGLRAVQGPRGEQLLIEVVDTGPGMTSEQASLLFNAFVQADNTVTPKFGGTGLGLTISQRLAIMMGGDVKLLRTALGQGTTFQITLPLVPVPGTPRISQLVVAESLKPATSLPAAVSLRGHVLLAEDGPDNQRLIALHIKRSGAKIDIADNGAIALRMIEAAAAAGKPYDLLLSDMQMPEMDGYSLATALRQRGSQIAIVALTAHAMAEDRAKCIDAGCDDYASKPIDKDGLLATCARWIGRASESRVGEARAA